MLGGPKGEGESNVQGVFLFDLIGRCELSAVSLGSISCGECYTYRNGTVTTTVDYVLMDLATASMTESCENLSEVELNLSDHLPLSVTLGCDPSCSKEQKAQFDGVDWQSARASGALADYEKEVSGSFPARRL